VSSESGPRKRTPLFKREERHEFRYQLSVFLAELFSWIFWLIPKPIRYLLADRAGDIFRRATNTYRDNVEANVAQVLGLTTESAEVRAAVKSIFHTSSRNFTDLITTPRQSSNSLVGSLKVRHGHWGIVDDALAQGKGVILVSGHLGSFDQVGQVFWARGYKLTIVTGRTTSRFIFDGVTHLRGSRGAKLVEPTPSGIRQVIRALRQGEVAVIVGDRDHFQNGRAVELFGRTTTLPPGAIRIARDTGATIVPIAQRRTGRTHELDILEPFTVPRTADLEADMAAGFANVLPRLEHAIRESINQWVMFQRVWPETPAPALRVFPIGSPLESELLEKVAQALPERSPNGRKSLVSRRKTDSEEGTDDDAHVP